MNNLHNQKIDQYEGGWKDVLMTQLCYTKYEYEMIVGCDGTNAYWSCRKQIYFTLVAERKFEKNTTSSSGWLIEWKKSIESTGMMFDKNMGIYFVGFRWS